MRTLARTVAAIAAVTLTAGVTAASASATRPQHTPPPVPAPFTTTVTDATGDVTLPDTDKTTLLTTVDLSEVTYVSTLGRKNPVLEISYTVEKALSAKKIRTQVSSLIGGSVRLTSDPVGFVSMTKVADGSRIKCAGTRVKVDRSRTVISQIVPLSCLTNAGLESAFITSDSALVVKKAREVIASDQADVSSVEVPFSLDAQPTS